MKRLNVHSFHQMPLAFSLLLSGLAYQVQANPTGGAVSQGSATISGTGSSQVNINQSSANAYINWSTFNIAAGETVNFNQPSATSVTWNYIGDANASSINGNINANGYVILQNPNGFTVGGLAVINAHGLVMTTASTPNLDLSGGGAWQFDAPPPLAKIVNYGTINITGGGQAYLIASDIENENGGTISAAGGKIGLFAGEQVLVSMSPDGRGLSTQVTLPQGSVDNEGNLTADGGSILAQAQTVNQNGIVQANSVQNVNGVIELVAGNSLKLGANSAISATGDSTSAAASSGGFVVLNAGKQTFSDTAGSTISVAGAAGGQNGIVEIMGSGITAGSLKSSYGSVYALLINPNNITLSSGATTTTTSPTLNETALANNYSQIDLQALNNITVSSAWTLAGSANDSTLSLTADNNITLSTSLAAGNNWDVNLTAGTAMTGTTVTAGTDSIALTGTAYLQALNGDLNLWAANGVTVAGGAIRTINGGNIGVTAEYGSVNSGTSVSGYNYFALGTGTAALPYYTPFAITGFGVLLSINFNQSNLGGISTAAGGNVTINAGANVTSFPTTTVSANDPGTGAFGPEAGNVTINAGGSVYGNFIVANGIGTINAGQNIGTGPTVSNPGAIQQNVALSLVSGSWNLDAQNNIYLQEVRNPNGVFNNTASAGNHFFDYSPDASVSLTAGNGVYITGANLPRPDGAVPLLLPPTLIINAGAGGVNLSTPSATSDGNPNDITLSDYDITLFPSAVGNLQITTTDGGWLNGGNANGSDATLFMSDSAQTHWFITDSGTQPFSEGDHSSAPPELNNDDPVILDISGSMEDVVLRTDKATEINVAGDMLGCSFYGENLQSSDVTAINVGGQIYNAGTFNSVTLSEPLSTLPVADLPPGAANNWYTILGLAIDVSKLPAQSLLGATPAQVASYISGAALFPGLNVGGNMTYDPTTQTLTAIGPLSSSLVAALESPTLTVVRYGANGLPLLNASGQLVTDTINWVPAPAAGSPSPNYTSIAFLNTVSQSASPLGVNNGAYIVGGMGEFDVTAGSINLGNSAGILTVGNGNIASQNYSFLTSTMQNAKAGGASINVTVGDDVTTTVNGVTTTTPSLTMPGSTIASLGGGNVTVTSTGGSMDLGSQSLLPFESTIMTISGIGLGIYSSAGGNVTVTAKGTINIDSSRIASFDGGNINVTSLTGDVNAGSGGAVAIPVNSFSTLFNLPEPLEYVYANGIVADTLAPLGTTKAGQTILVLGAATQPGNITVSTPQGSIYASLGGILQESLSGTLPDDTFINLTAGTPANNDWSSTAPPEYIGNIIMGDSGVIGGTVNVKATGQVSGLLISSQNADVQAQSLGTLTILSGGTANVSGSSSGVGITIIGAQGVSATGIGSGASLLGQNVSVNGGAAQNTLGSSASSTASSQSAAGQSTAAAQQQIAMNSSGDDDDQKKKKKPAIRRVGRVTVLLSAAGSHDKTSPVLADSTSP